MPHHEFDRREAERELMQGPVAVRIPEITSSAMLALRLATTSYAFPAAPLTTAIEEALRLLHTEFPRCEPCEAARYRQGKADALAEEMERVKTEAGRLFAEEQDHEARYLRDRLPKMRTSWMVEVQQVESLNTRRGHTCSFDGIQQERA